LAELDNVTTTTDLNVYSVEYKMRDKDGYDAATLAHNWGIGIVAAKRTRLVTTLSGIRIMIDQRLIKRYKTNDMQLQYLRLSVTMITYTMYSTSLSRQHNKADQMLCTDFVFVTAFPIQKEIEAREALSLLFHRDRVPDVMVMDGSKEKTEGQFRRKLCDAGFHIKQT
jgi:hypothetical protein